jgi:hypothetical protein
MSIQPNDMRAGSFNWQQAGPSDTISGKLTNTRYVEFSDPFPVDPNLNVIVIPMVQTFNGSNTPGLRITDVTNTGFKIRLNELVVNKDGKTQALSDGAHNNETIGWVAIRI